MRNNHKLGKILVVYCVSLLLLKLNSLLLGDSPQLSIKGVVCYSVPVLIVGIFYWIEKKRNTILCKQEKLSFYKIKGGIYILIAGGIFCILNLLSLKDGAFSHFQPKVCIYLLCTCLLTGVFEEIVFRGLLQNMICEMGKQEEKQGIFCVFIASVIFGITHILNLMEQPQFIVGTFTQIIYTFCLGMLLGAVYWKSHSLWIVILLHGLFNFLGQFSVVFEEVQKEVVIQSDLNLVSGLIQIVVMFPCVVIGKKMLK